MRHASRTRYWARLGVLAIVVVQVVLLTMWWWTRVRPSSSSEARDSQVLETAATGAGEGASEPNRLPERPQPRDELERLGVRVAGVVEDVAGGPVAGAVIVAKRTRAEPGEGVTAISDDEGRFELRAMPGEQQLLVRASGYALGGRTISAPNEAVTLKLIPESVLVGRVVDAASREGLEGVEVNVGFMVETKVISGADGRFELRGLRPGRYQAQAVGDHVFGIHPRAIHLGLGQTSEEIEIEVYPAYPLDGELLALGLDGREQACTHGSVSVGGQVVGTRMQDVDAQGRVHIAGLPAGRYQVRPICYGQLPLEPMDIEIGPDTPVQRWRFESALAIAGVVLDADGEPVPDVYVHAQGQSAKEGFAGAEISRTDADGRFRLRPLKPGSYRVWLRNQAESTIEVELATSNIEDLELRSVSFASLLAVVRDADGQPQANVTVYVDGSKGESLGYRISDGDGRARFDTLAPGSVYVAMQGERSPDKPRPHGRPLTLREGEVSEIELVVEQKRGVIRGSVSEAGAPAGEAWVVASRASITDDAFEVGPILCEQDGSFELDGLAEGRWNLKAYRPGGGEALAEDVALGARVTLALAQPTGLVGRVRAGDGSLPSFFTITLRPARDGGEGTIESSFYQSEGRFELDAIAPGRWIVEVASPEGSASEQIVLRAGDRSVLDIELESRVTLRGRLVDATTRAPVTSLEIGVIKGHKGRVNQTFRPDGDGNFVLRSVPVGPVQLVMTPKNWADKRYRMQFVGVVAQASPAEQDIGEVSVVGAVATVTE